MGFRNIYPASPLITPSIEGSHKGIYIPLMTHYRTDTWGERALNVPRSYVWKTTRFFSYTQSVYIAYNHSYFHGK